jgi:hypothetical protein
MVSLRMPGSQRVNLTERLEIVQRELVTQKMENDVLKSTATWRGGLQIAQAIKWTYAWLEANI